MIRLSLIRLSAKPDHHTLSPISIYKNFLFLCFFFFSFVRWHDHNITRVAWPHRTQREFLGALFVFLFHVEFSSVGLITCAKE